jgi:hypothetical protein
MSRSLGFIGLIIVVAIGAFIYMKQVQSASPAGVEGAGANPQSTIDIAGVKNDLLSIAQAERAHMASQGKYVSVDDLVSAGELNVIKTRRAGWTFSSEANESSFKVTATYPTNPPTRLSVDESMSVKTE